MDSVTFGYRNYLICSGCSVWHIYLKMKSILSNICGTIKLRQKRSIEKDGILAWHKVSETIKGFKKKVFQFHWTCQPISEVVCFRVRAEVSNESRRKDKQEIDFFKPRILRLILEEEGWTTSGQSGSQTHCDDVVGGPDSLERACDRSPVIFHTVTAESSLAQVFASSDVGWISYKKIDPLPYVWETSKPSRLQNLLPLKWFWHFCSQKHKVAKKKKDNVEGMNVTEMWAGFIWKACLKGCCFLFLQLR